MADNPDTRQTRGPSAMLLILGVLALLVSLWAFISPSSLLFGGAIPFGWVLVFAAIIVGGLLVLSPRKRR